MATANQGRPAGVFDREIDLGGRADRRGRRQAAERPEVYLRLVANPFLAVLGGVAWYAAMRGVLAVRRFDLFVPTLAALVLIPLLLEYHCLDCGATGRLYRASRHGCDRVVRRRQAGRPRRFRGPTVASQTVLWLAAFAVAWVALRVALG